MKSHFAGLLIAIMSCFLTVNLSQGDVSKNGGSENTNFRPVKLPYSLYIEIPKSWGVLGEDGRTLLETNVESVLDLSVFGNGKYKETGFQNLLMARVMSDAYYALISINITRDQRTQKYLNSMSLDDVNKYGYKIKNGLDSTLRSAGAKYFGWVGIRKDKAYGYTCLIYSYKRSGKAGSIIVVETIEIPLGDKTVSVTTSVREDQIEIFQNIFSRIKSSFKLGDKS